MRSHSIRRLMLALSSYYTLSQAQTQGCQGTQESKGFDVNIYSYSLFGLSWLSDGFFTTGYSTGTLQGTVSGVTDINFFDISNPLFGNDEIYGFPTTLNRFAMELKGYYLAPQTGHYNFKLHADDGASFQIGVKSGLTCCGSDIVDSLINDTMIISRYYHFFAASTTVQLIAGTYYPVRIVYYNNALLATLQLTVTLPNNSKQTTFDNVYQLELPHCSSLTSIISTSSVIKSSMTDSEVSSTTIELPEESSALSQSSTTAIAIKTSLSAISFQRESGLVKNSYTEAFGGSSTTPKSYTARGVPTQPNSTVLQTKSVTTQSASIDSSNLTHMQSFTLSGKATSSESPPKTRSTCSSESLLSMSWNTIVTRTTRQPAVSIQVLAIPYTGYTLRDKYTSVSVLTQLSKSSCQSPEPSSGTFGSSEKFLCLLTQFKLSSEVSHKSSSPNMVSSLVNSSIISKPGEARKDSGSSMLLSQVISMLPGSLSHEPSLPLGTFTTSAQTIVSKLSESYDYYNSPKKPSSQIGSLYSSKLSFFSGLSSIGSLSEEHPLLETTRASSYGTGSNLSSNGSSQYSVSGIGSLSGLTPESRPSSVLLLPTTTSFRPSPRSTVDLVHSSSSVLSLSKTDSIISESNRTHSLESSSRFLSRGFSALSRLNRSESKSGSSSSLSRLASLETSKDFNNSESSANSPSSLGSLEYLDSVSSLKNLSSNKLPNKLSLMKPLNAHFSSINNALVTSLSNHAGSTIPMLSLGSLKPYSTSNSFKDFQTVSSLSYSVSSSASITVSSAEFSSFGASFSSLGSSKSLSSKASSNLFSSSTFSSSRPSGPLDKVSSMSSQSSKSSSIEASSNVSSSITFYSSSSLGSWNNLSSVVARYRETSRSFSAGTSLSLSRPISSSFLGSITSSSLSSSIASNSSGPVGTQSNLNFGASQPRRITSRSGISSNLSTFAAFSSSRPSSPLRNLSSMNFQFKSSISFDTFPTFSSSINFSSSKPSNLFGTYRSPSLRTPSNFSSLTTGISSITSGSLNNLSFVDSQSGRSSSSFGTPRPFGTVTSSNLARPTTVNNPRRPRYLGNLSSAVSQYSKSSRIFTSGISFKPSSSVSSNSSGPSSSLSDLSSAVSQSSELPSCLDSSRSSSSGAISKLLSSIISSSCKTSGSLCSLSSAAPQLSNFSRSPSTSKSSCLRTTLNLSRSINSSSSRTSRSQDNLSYVAPQSSKTSSSLGSSGKSSFRLSADPSSIITSSSAKPSDSLNNPNSIVYQSERPSSNIGSSGSSSSSAFTKFSSSISSSSSWPSGAKDNLSFTASESNRYGYLSSGSSSSLSNFISSSSSKPSGFLTSSSELSQASRSFSRSISGKPSSPFSLGFSNSLTTSITIISRRPNQLSVSPKTSRISRSVSDISSDRVNQSLGFLSHSTQIWSLNASSLLQLKSNLSSSKSSYNLSIYSRPGHLFSASRTLQPNFFTSSLEWTFSRSSNGRYSGFGIHSQSCQSSNPGSRSLLACSLSRCSSSSIGPSMRESSSMPLGPSSLITKTVIQLLDSSKKFTASSGSSFESSTITSLDAFSPTIISSTSITRSWIGSGNLGSNSEILSYSDPSSSSQRNKESHPYLSANINSLTSTSYWVSSTITGCFDHFPLTSLPSTSKKLNPAPSANGTPTSLLTSRPAGSRPVIDKQSHASLSAQPTSSSTTSLPASSSTSTSFLNENNRESLPNGTLPTFYSDISLFAKSSWSSRVRSLFFYTTNTEFPQNFSTSIGLSEGSSIVHQCAILESTASVSSIQSNLVYFTIRVVESSALVENSPSVTLSTIFPTELLSTFLEAPPRLTVTLESGGPEGHSSEAFQTLASSVRSSSAAQSSAASLLTSMVTSAKFTTSLASTILSILPSPTWSNLEYAGATNSATGSLVEAESNTATATDSLGLYESDFSSFGTINTLKFGKDTTTHDPEHNPVPTGQRYLATESQPRNKLSAFSYESLDIKQSKGFATPIKDPTQWATNTISTSKSDMEGQHNRQPAEITNKAVRMEIVPKIFLACVALFSVL